MQPKDGGVERDVCDKLLMLCDMFGVTLDDLVMGDVCASAGRGGAGRVGCVDAGRMDLAADTAGVAASDGVVDSAVGAVGVSGSRHRRLQECPILQNRTLVEGDG